MLYKTSVTCLDQVKVNASTSCVKCGSKEWVIITEETKITILFSSSKNVKARVECLSCGKEIQKNFGRQRLLIL